MTENPRGLVLATHGGKFHCDEVFAHAVLRMALGVKAPGADYTLLRTRAPELIEAADIVWDVGSRFDATAQRFDHHQRGAPLREDGTPFSSAGLVWQSHGLRAVATWLGGQGQGQGDETLARTIADEIDQTVVRRIDEIDNGVAARGANDTLGLAALIGDCNPRWDDPAATGMDAGDEAFLRATALAEGVLGRRIAALRARHVAAAAVLAAHRAGEDPRLLVLDRGMPWQNAVFAHGLAVLFAVSPASNGNWMIDAMPPEPGSFAQRLPLPLSWAGLQGEALASESGVVDAVFVHLRRFVGAARTRDGAVAMAQRAIMLGTSA